MQRPKQEGLGAAFAQGMMNEIGGAHAANILQKATTYLGIMFFGISLLLSILISSDARASRALGEAAVEKIGDKSAGTAGDPTKPLDFTTPDLGPIPGVDTPLGGLPADGGETPEGGTTTPEGGTATPEGGTATPEGGTATPEGGTATPEGGEAELPTDPAKPE